MLEKNFFKEDFSMSRHKNGAPENETKFHRSPKIVLQFHRTLIYNWIKRKMYKINANQGVGKSRQLIFHKFYQVEKNILELNHLSLSFPFSSQLEMLGSLNGSLEKTD